MTDRCFNCRRTDDTAPYSFDMDLPTIVGCATCILALSMGDDDTLRALAGKRRQRTKPLTRTAPTQPQEPS